MKHGKVRIPRALEHPASKVIYLLFNLFGHVFETGLFYRRLIVSVLGVIMTAGVFAQAAKLVVTNFELAVVIDVVPPLTCSTVCVLYLPIGYAWRKQYRQLYELLSVYEDQQRTEEEEKIQERYEEYIRILSTVLSIMTLLGSVGLLLPGLVPPVLDYLIPLNESRQRTLPFQVEYFIDQEKYFYEILVIQYINTLAVIAIAGSGEVIFLLCIIYTCGMFAILGCKLENITKKENGDKEEMSLIVRDEEIIPRIREYIESHTFLLKFIGNLSVSTDLLLALTLLVSLIIVSISLVQVINPQLTTVKSVLMAVCALGQFFIVSLAGQLIVNASEKLPLDTYNSYWYRCSVKVQKYFVLLILKSSRPCGITAMKTFLISFQNFSAVIQTCASYAMVLKQFDE